MGRRKYEVEKPHIFQTYKCVEFNSLKILTSNLILKGLFGRVSPAPDSLKTDLDLILLAKHFQLNQLLHEFDHQNGGFALRFIN